MAHRLFVALRPPISVREALLSIMGGIAGARWQGDDQLHVTLRFVGEVEAAVANALSERLADVYAEPFTLTIRGVGHFEKKGRVHTLWAGLAPSPELAALQRRVERACRAAGLAPEARKFAPHITLARLNSSAGEIGAFLAAQGRLAAGPWTVEDFRLVESHLSRDGARYEPVVLYGLSGP